MRVVFAGTPDIAIPSLQAILDSGAEVPLVLTKPDARGRRGSELLPSPVKAFALSQGLRVETPERASAPETVAMVREVAADVAGVVAYGQILKPDLIAAVRTHWINLHFSVLPAWRGAAPVQRAIMAGDEITGATTFVIEEGLDTGPVVGMLTEGVEATESAGELLGRLALVGAPLLVESLQVVARGTATPTPQPEHGVSYANKLTRDDAYVRWDLPAHVVDRQVRGCTPAPGAWTTLPDGTPAKLGLVAPVDDAPAAPPGTITETDGRVLVSTGAGSVALSSIAPSGKKWMDAAAWLRGARLAPGAQLGEA